MPREYAKSVIMRLHEIKRSYQPNMLLSLSVTCLIFVIAGCIISLLQGATTNHGIDSSAGSILPPNRLKTSGSSAGSGVAHGPGLDQPGFASFRRYPVERSTPQPVSYRQTRYDAPIEDTDFSFGAFDTSTFPDIRADVDFGLPAAKTYFDLLPSMNWSVSVPDRDIFRSANAYSPPVIEFSRVRYPERGWYTNGLVTVVFIITADGRIQNYRVVKEEPAGLNFARALKDAINESIFFPGNLNGTKVAVRIRLTYEFCWGCSKPTGLQVSDGVIVKGAM